VADDAAMAKVQISFQAQLDTCTDEIKAHFCSKFTKQTGINSNDCAVVCTKASARYRRLSIRMRGLMSTFHVRVLLSVSSLEAAAEVQARAGELMRTEAAAERFLGVELIGTPTVATIALPSIPPPPFSPRPGQDSALHTSARKRRGSMLGSVLGGIFGALLVLGAAAITIWCYKTRRLCFSSHRFREGKLTSVKIESKDDVIHVRNNGNEGMQTKSGEGEARLLNAEESYAEPSNSNADLPIGLTAKI